MRTVQLHRVALFIALFGFAAPAFPATLHNHVTIAHARTLAPVATLHLHHAISFSHPSSKLISEPSAQAAPSTQDTSFFSFFMHSLLGLSSHSGR